MKMRFGRFRLVREGRNSCFPSWRQTRRVRIAGSGLRRPTGPTLYIRHDFDRMCLADILESLGCRVSAGAAVSGETHIVSSELQRLQDTSDSINLHAHLYGSQSIRRSH